MNIIFLGPPGAGKGTHAQLLTEELRIPQISTGEILRKAIRAETPTGLKAKSFIDRGELVPDEVVIAIVRERLQEADCAAGYILDGFPRTVPQAECLETFAPIDAVLNFILPDEKIVARLCGRRVCPDCGGTYHISSLEGKDTCAKCGAKLIQRKDDTPETIRNRLSVYHAQTAPLVDFYRSKGLVRDIDCLGRSVEENHRLVRAALGL